MDEKELKERLEGTTFFTKFPPKNSGIKLKTFMIVEFDDNRRVKDVKGTMRSFLDVDGSEAVKIVLYGDVKDKQGIKRKVFNEEDSRVKVYYGVDEDLIYPEKSD